MAARITLLAISVAVCLVASIERALRPPEHVRTTLGVKDVKGWTLHWYSPSFKPQGGVLTRMMISFRCARKSSISSSLWELYHASAEED